MAKTERKELTPIERSIRSRERGVERMEANIEQIRKDADTEIAEVRRRIQEKKVLLDALKRGAIKA